MLIPIGFFGSGAAAGAYELISTTVLGSNTSSVTFTNGSWSTYKHLQIRATARITRSDVNSGSIGLRFNADSGSNYAFHYLQGTGTSVQSGESTTQSQIFAGVTSGGLSGSGVFGATVIDVLDFGGTKNKTIRSFTGTHDGSTNNVALRSGVWLSTAALTSITVSEFSGSYAFLAGSRFSLYGIKGV